MTRKWVEEVSGDHREDLVRSIELISSDIYLSRV